MRRAGAHYAAASLLSCGLVAWLTLALSQEPAKPSAGARLGRLVVVDAPITERSEAQVRRVVAKLVKEAERQNAEPLLIVELRPGRSEYGKSLDLAKYLARLPSSGVRTAAFLPETINGHSVLAALACEEILIAPEAQFGDAGAYEKVIGPDIRSGYAEIAGAHKTVPLPVALKMLDRELELLLVETEVSREFVLAQDLEELRKTKAIQSSRVLSPAGTPASFRGEEARELGLVQYLAADRRALAHAVGLDRRLLAVDPGRDGDWKPIRVPLKGPLNSELLRQTQRMIEDEIRERDVNFICLWIDSPGGAPAESVGFAQFLASLDPENQTTVAYVAREALSDAAFIALACDQVLLAPRAVLGGEGAATIAAGQIEPLARGLESVASRKSLSKSLVAALVDPNVEVFTWTHSDGHVDYFSAEEMAQQKDADQWRRGERITNPGAPLFINAEEAERYGMANDVVENFQEVRERFGLENDPTLVEPGWADFLIDALRKPGVAWLLLFIGIVGLYIELQAPGIGIGGLTAGICFLLFFWSNFLGGTAGWLEVLLFLAGLACLAMELMVLPGFGIFGLTGGMLMLASLILATQTFVIPHNSYQFAQLRNSLLMLVGAAFGVIAVAFAARRYLPHTPMLRHVVLAPPSDRERESIAQREALVSLDHLRGAEGAAETRLVPAGLARFGDELVDVVSDGDLIERGAPVVVVAVQGNRVVVRKAEEA